MSGGNPEEVASSDRTAQVPDLEVIAVRGNVRTWIEPWYGAYAILGALTSGLAIISVPLVITNGGGTALQIGTAIAVQNLGALFAPLWGTVADRTRAYRAVFFTGFVLIGLGFLGLTFLRGFSVWVSCALPPWLRYRRLQHSRESLRGRIHAKGRVEPAHQLAANH